MLKQGEPTELVCPNCGGKDCRMYQFLKATLVVELAVCPKCAAMIDPETKAVILPTEINTEAGIL